MVTKRCTNDTNTQHKHSVPEVTDKRIQMLSVSQFGRCIFQRMAELSVVKADPVNSLFPLYLIGSPWPYSCIKKLRSCHIGRLTVFGTFCLVNICIVSYSGQTQYLHLIVYSAAVSLQVSTLVVESVRHQHVMNLGIRWAFIAQRRNAAFHSCFRRSLWNGTSLSRLCDTFSFQI